MSSEAGTQNEEVSKLKKEIIECQNETQRLLCEKKWWPKASQGVEQSLKTAVALLRRRIRWSLIEKSQFEKHKNFLKSAEEIESNLKESLERMEMQNGKYKKSKESRLVSLERSVDRLEKMLSNESSDSELYAIRVDMENRLKNLDVFCTALYSTFPLKESSESNGVLNVKDAKPDHFGGQKVRKRRGGRKKPQ